MPTNLYGPNDNYDLQNSHVLPAMIRKFHEAKLAGNAQVELWGTGSPMREFLHADDLAEACVFLMENYSDKQFVNIGTGVDVTIKELAETIKKEVGYEGEIYWNTEKPDGTPRKLMDVSKINGLGWKHKLDLSEGIKLVYAEYKEKHK
jgi:GDP-L-fucose synthase